MDTTTETTADVETCRRGHELTPENVYRYTTKAGRPRWACRTCVREAQARTKARRRGESVPMLAAPRGANRTECDNGHPWTPENVRESVRASGERRRECKVCLREARARYRRSKGIKPRNPGKPRKPSTPREPGKCKRGHDITVPENVYVATRGDGSTRRQCRVCKRMADNARRAANRTTPDAMERIKRNLGEDGSGMRKPRRFYCANGHRWTPSNTIIEKRPDGGTQRRCRKCRAEEYRRRRQRPGRGDRIRQQDRERSARRRATVRLEPGDPRHGTVNGYNSYNCRCESCTAAIREYHRARRERLARLAEPLVEDGWDMRAVSLDAIAEASYGYDRVRTKGQDFDPVLDSVLAREDLASLSPDDLERAADLLLAGAV